MAKRFVVRGTHSGLPFEHKAEARSSDEAEQVVINRLRERYPRQIIEVTEVSEAEAPTRESRIREAVKFRQE